MGHLSGASPQVWVTFLAHLPIYVPPFWQISLDMGHLSEKISLDMGHLSGTSP